MKSGASTNLLLPHFKMIHFEADFKEREMEPLAWLFGMPLQIVFNILSFSEKERYYVTFCNSILRTTKPYLRCTICTTSRDKKPNTSHLAVCSYVSQFYSLFYILVPFVWGPYKSWNLAELWYQLYVPPAEHFNLCQGSQEWFFLATAMRTGSFIRFQQKHHNLCVTFKANSPCLYGIAKVRLAFIIDWRILSVLEKKWILKLPISIIASLLIILLRIYVT